MNRRRFLKNISLAGLSPLVLNGLPVQALANQLGLQHIAASSTNDRVLVLIQLHGGNDGLNTLVPLNQYSQYQRLRSNIAIPDKGLRKFLTLDSSLPDEQQLGLHPDMKAFKNLYESGHSAIVQSVAYDDVNGSHFRSRDVWFMGGDSNDTLGSGWAGRYLDKQYPSYPDSYPSAAMADPLAIEIGSRVSLAFHREDGIPMAVALDDPDKFHKLVSEVGGSLQQGASSGNTTDYFDQEISYIAGVEEKSNQYAARLHRVFQQGKNSSSVVYPGKYPFQAPAGNAANGLSVQLKTIARLLSGGCQTRIFLARIDGFDTHAYQTEPNDPTMGTHAALLYNLFSAIEAFQNDLRLLGLEDKVMTLTFSEFGRRAASNGSYGTDHGAAAPMFVFGKHVNPGVVGANADLTHLQQGNIKHVHDYRQVLGTLMKDWMQADASTLDHTLFADYMEPSLPLVQQPSSGAPSGSSKPVSGTVGIQQVLPNPATTHVDVIYTLENTTSLQIKLLDMHGNTVAQQSWDARGQGRHKTRLMLPANPKKGIYVLIWQARDHKMTRQVLIQP